MPRGPLHDIAMAGSALTNLKVVELGHGVCAPFCARLLADYGADVVKVEPPEGDVTRRWGPFPADQPHPEKSGLFFFLNTSKRGVTLDLETAAGRSAFLSLIGQADVLIENQPPQRLRDWGLDYASLARVNPGLVMVSITPFGQTGPYAEWNAYDLNAYHLSAAGHRYCGRPGEPPLQHGTFSAEFFGAYVAAVWGLAAVHGREQSGGQQLDVSCAQAVAALFVGAQSIGAYAQDGRWESRTGIGMPLGAPATILPAKDGHVWMLALEPGQWNGLRRAMGDPEWADLEMFQDMFVRAQNAEAIYPLIEQWTREHTKQEIMDLCQANACPTTALLTVGEVAEHPHLAARGYLVDLEHPVLGHVRTMGAPIRLSDGPGGPSRPAPLLGEHNAEVLGALGNASGGAHPAGVATATTPGRGSASVETGAAPAKPPRRTGKPPLAGVRIANFGWGWLGPVCGQTLGFLGAEVLKIESRTRVDINRTLPPFGGGIRDPDRSLMNHAAWAMNGSVTIDLKKPEGIDLARRLVAHCDVALENFGPGVMARLGLGYDELRTVNPEIVMVSMPAAGLFGPLAGIRTYGMSLSSITGLDSLTGYVGEPPMPVENAFADPLGGIIGALAALLGLCRRERTGRGQHVDFSQQEGILQLVAPAFMDYVMNGRVAGPIGNRHPLAAGAPHGVFPCAGDDHWISIAVLTDREWQGLVRAMGTPQWAREPQLDGAAGRVARVAYVHERLAAWTRGFEHRELARLLQEHGVAAAPVLSVAELLDDPQHAARRTFVEVEHPLGFPETIYGPYVGTSGFSPEVRPGPTMGQDNERVFKELMGIADESYRRLVEAKVIF